MTDNSSAFSTQWQSLGGQVYPVATPNDWLPSLRAVLSTMIDPTSPAVVGFDNGQWPPGLPWNAICEEFGGVFYDMNNLYGESHLQAVRDLVTQAGVGITGAAWAAADTGTVALYATARTSLSASLLPPSHLILLKQSQIYETVTQGLKAVHASGSLPHLVKLISGPSMTADIEGQLVIGVHGPGHVACLIGDW